MFPVTQGLKQILPGQTTCIASTKRSELCLVKQLAKSLEHEVPVIPIVYLMIELYYIEFSIWV